MGSIEDNAWNAEELRWARLSSQVGTHHPMGKFLKRHLAQMCGLSEDRMRSILDGDEPAEDEKESIARGLKMRGSALQESLSAIDNDGLDDDGAADDIAADDYSRVGARR
jgi:hypothetical protein